MAASRSIHSPVQTFGLLPFCTVTLGWRPGSEIADSWGMTELNF